MTARSSLTFFLSSIPIILHSKQIIYAASCVHTELT